MLLHRVFSGCILPRLLYNALIGYLLLHREEPRVQSLWFSLWQCALHFIVNDNGLREHHQRTYEKLVAGYWQQQLCSWAIGLGTHCLRRRSRYSLLFSPEELYFNVLKKNSQKNAKVASGLLPSVQVYILRF
ncbi:MAG: hypothetical protein CLLPBCKN_000839 [Chroococcidiopsis cubana SAG 39.79]|uniref:hypothetical protein n=1 Tax=Chroococcidiopsis cubana TaxID=171392 RepID=UPI002AC3D2DA|nr:hypothetical protein [Chroococcidiopsis cubana]MDZ4871451.1 hypothetical protein [Chroococcidiopsis cubana SAG 39.79]